MIACEPMTTTAGRFLGIAHLVSLLMALSAAEGGSSSIRVAAFRVYRPLAQNQNASRKSGQLAAGG
jgi:hypothetical protein